VSLRQFGLIALFCLSWSSAFPAAKLAMQVSPPLLFLGLRFLLAAALLLGWAALRGQLRGVPWTTLAWLGLLNQAGYQGVAWLGMQRASAGVATIIVSLSPILIAVAAVPMLGERLSRQKVVGLLLGLIGAAWVVRDRIAGGESGWGMVLLFVSLACMTAGTLAFKRAAPRAGLAVAVGGQQLAAGIALLLAGLVSERGAIELGTQFWLVLAWVVLVVSVGSFLLWFALLRRYSAASASALHFVMPPLGLVMSWAVLGEPLLALDLIGVVPIAAGIWLVTRAPA